MISIRPKNGTSYDLSAGVNKKTYTLVSLATCPAGIRGMTGRQKRFLSACDPTLRTWAGA